jgi:hypothetical protein
MNISDARGRLCDLPGIEARVVGAEQARYASRDRLAAGAGASLVQHALAAVKLR